MVMEQTHGAILLHNTMAFDRQHADEFKQAIRNAVRFAKEHAPQLMVQVYIDDNNALCHSFQLYPDSQAVLRHWELSDPYISEVMKYCAVQGMEVYGSPNEAARTGILGAVSEYKVTFTPELIGYYHLG